jgi:transcriptional regulator with XRE-family HTH domain
LRKELDKKSARSTRGFIGHQLRDLRKGRGLSQGQFGAILGISQSSLSEVELGNTSLSAEEFIQVLKFFNVPASHFDPAPGDASGAVQKALAAHGAAYLVEDPDLLPSENLAQVDAVIRETLVSGENPRALTALAPVIIHNIGRLNLAKLYVQFKEFSLEDRYGWLIDNILAAIALVLKEAPPRKQALALAKATNLLQGHRDRVFTRVGPHDFEDYLGLPIASPKTKNEVLRNRSEISKAWNILTTIQVEDFAKAIKGCHGHDQARPGGPRSSGGPIPFGGRQVLHGRPCPPGSPLRGEPQLGRAGASGLT